MDYGISDVEKLQIVIDHLRVLERNKFDLTMTMEELISHPDSTEEEINLILDQINAINTKQDALAQQAAALDVPGEI